MKAKFVVAILLIMIVAKVNASPIVQLKKQETTKTIKGIFDGYDEDDGYIFLITDEEDGNEKYMYFNYISDEALKAVNLQSKEFEGQSFEITFKIEEQVEVDDDGMEDTYEILTITGLKKV
ncbi:hypothetical protein [Winogradskyella sp. A3E31]|uniref:hypothetical protein n=1 Tax=Winogradskyella sp. A3E31 TaxID=3349637 RepID=UPI00398BAB6D